MQSLVGENREATEESIGMESVFFSRVWSWTRGSSPRGLRMPVPSWSCK